MRISKLSKLLILPFALNLAYNLIIAPKPAAAQIFNQANSDFDISDLYKASVYAREFNKNSEFDTKVFGFNENKLLRNEYYQQTSTLVDIGTEIYGKLEKFLVGYRFSLDEGGFVFSNKKQDKKLFIGSSRTEFLIMPKKSLIDEIGLYYKYNENDASFYGITIKKRW